MFGDRGEQAAARFLRRKGMRIILRNYRTPRGEIDLVARDGETLVFVEVKSRRKGSPVEAVTAQKQKRIATAALIFLKKHHLLEHNVRWRFDIVAVLWPEEQRHPDIQHFPNAFATTGQGQMFS
jgi:putative endonuclease